MPRQNPIILALDTPTLDLAKRAAYDLADSVACFKIGLELFTAEGIPRVLEAFKGLSVFADVKFSDIPNTVGAATQALTKYPVQFFDVHATCGTESIRAAAANKKSAKLLVVTVLTSISNTECQALFKDSAQNTVERFAQMALNAGADGIVCSPQELEFLADSTLIKVVPGVRPAWALPNDQKRTLTPAQAIKLGADYLVMGRPILNPPNKLTPKEAARKILEEIG